MNVGALKRSVVLETPSAPIADPDGGFTQTWTPLVPSPVAASIEQATARSIEKLVANVAISQASKVVTIRFHPQVTQQTRLTWTDRRGTHTANITDIVDLAGNNEAMVLVCSEVTL